MHTERMMGETSFNLYQAEADKTIAVLQKEFIIIGH